MIKLQVGDYVREVIAPSHVYVVTKPFEPDDLVPDYGWAEVSRVRPLFCAGNSYRIVIKSGVWLLGVFKVELLDRFEAQLLLVNNAEA